MSLEFEWASAKAEENLKKHGVTLTKPSQYSPTRRHAFSMTPIIRPTRPVKIIVGYSQRQRLPLVSFTERAPRVRIISARKATKRERQGYEQSTKATFQKRS